MKIKIALRRPGGSTVDLHATVDPAATVGDLAAALRDRDPHGSAAASGAVTLALVDDRHTVLDPDALVSDSGLVSGSDVTLSALSTSVGGPRGQAAAVVRVVEGPDAGATFSLPRGTSVVGRASGCEVRLRDTSVSRQHARLHITDVAEVADLGSSNGIAVDGGQVSRAVLRPRDHVRLADTVLTVEVLAGSAAVAGGTSTAFNRSPVLEPAYEGGELVLPEPPHRQQSQRFPVIALIAPVVFGGLMFAVTGNPLSLMFIALSPLMTVANALESRYAGGKANKGAMAAWTREIDELTVEAREAHATERARRLAEHASAEEARTAVLHRTPLLWSRRPDHERFLQLRLGRGPQPSRTQVKLPGARKTEKAAWQRLEEFADAFADVDDVPVVADLREAPLGVAGPRSVATAVVRGLVAQVAGLHSPSEVVLAAVLPTDGSADWDWLKWLPHSTSPHSPLPVHHLAANPASVSALLAAVEELVDQRAGASDGPAVVLLVEDAAATDRARLVSLAARGPAAGVHVVWLSATVERLPACCGCVLDLAPDGQQGTVGRLADGGSTPVQVERADAPAVLQMARSMSPLVDSGAPLDDATDLPRSVSWLALHDPATATTPSVVVERWQESRSLLTGPFASLPRRGKPGSLRAVLGQAAGEPHLLDLRTHGPHALVGGTTGSGKSELLQSWILSMAASHSPQRVTFLLVDYKGGSAFRECLDLPHTVGLVTDLSPHLVRRALTSLSAELKRREELLAHKKKKDLIELEQSGDPDTPPSLVIVVDEFAALVHEVPEFVDGVVNVAQRGRSLGLHLILATQRPAGVIKDNLRANTNLRIALRVADEGDSTDVIGSPLAAGFDPSLPGRAVSKTGPGRLVPFQSAYAGGWTTDEPAAPDVVVEELTLGVPVVWEARDVDDRTTSGALGPTDIARVVATVRRAAEQAQVPAPRRPWLPELDEVYELAELPTRRRDDELVFGKVDDPHNQDQPTIAFHPDRDGNLAVYGTGGAGKSGLLRTLAVAAGFTYRGGPCQVYGLDFGARGLTMLEDLPHVGSIIPGSDHERLARLLGDLRRLVDERAARYARAKAGTITEYRSLAGAPDEHRVLLLVDGIAAFRSAYESSARVQWFELFQSIAMDGRPVGVHVVLSADRPASVPSSLGSAVQRRVVLRLADDNDYATLGEPADVLASASPPGRAVVDGAEVQVAVLGGTRNTLEQAHAIASLAGSMRRAGASVAPAVESLTDRISLDVLPPLADGLPTVGIAGTHLGPVGFTPSGPFVVTGPPGSGRSTALQTLVESVRRTAPAAQLHYVGNRRSALAGAPWWATSSTSVVDAAATATQLSAQLAETGAAGRVVLVVEGIGDYVNSPADMPLQQLVKAMVAEEHLVLVEGETSAMSQGSSLLSLLKSARSGLALQPESSEANVFRTEFPRLRRIELPVGRGLLVTGGRTVLVQVALPPTQPTGRTGSPPRSLRTG